MQRLAICAYLLLVLPFLTAAIDSQNAKDKLSNLNIPFTQREFEHYIWSGDSTVVELFLAAGMSPNLRELDSNWPLLIRAIHRHQTGVVQILLQYGANVDISLDQATALMVAASAGYTEIVRVLLDYKANVHFRGSMAGLDGTALHFAAQQGRTEAIKELLRYGADPNVKNADGTTPLMWAAGSGDPSAVVALLDAGADSSATSNDGNRTVWDAAIFSQRSSIDVIRVLIERKAPVNLRTRDGDTPLHKALISSDPDIVRLLLSNGADVNARNALGKTCLHRAGHVEIVRTLLDYGADVNARDPQGYTPLHDAVAWGLLEKVKLLVVRGANINARDEGGTTALQLTPYCQDNPKGVCKEITNFLIGAGSIE